jgi:hypothetical protein
VGPTSKHPERCLCRSHALAVTRRPEGRARTRSVNQCRYFTCLTRHVRSPTCFGGERLASCNKFRLLQKRRSYLMARLVILLRIVTRLPASPYVSQSIFETNAIVGIYDPLRIRIYVYDIQFLISLMILSLTLRIHSCQLIWFEVPGIRRWTTPHQDIVIITLAYRM